MIRAMWLTHLVPNHSFHNILKELNPSIIRPFLPQIHASRAIVSTRRVLALLTFETPFKDWKYFLDRIFIFYLKKWSTWWCMFFTACCWQEEVLWDIRERFVFNLIYRRRRYSERRVDMNILIFWNLILIFWISECWNDQILNIWRKWSNIWIRVHVGGDWWCDLKKLWMTIRVGWWTQNASVVIDLLSCVFHFQIVMTFDTIISNAIGISFSCHLTGSLPSLFGGLIIALLFLYAAYLFYVKSFETARTFSMIASFVLFGLGAFRYVSVEKKTLPIVFMVMGIVMLVVQLLRRSGGEGAKFK